MFRLYVSADKNFCDPIYCSDKIAYYIKNYDRDSVCILVPDHCDIVYNIVRSNYSFYNVPVPIRWNLYGSKAVLIQSYEAALKSQAGLFFWNGKNQHILFQIRMFQSMHRKTKIIYYQNDDSYYPNQYKKLYKKE